MKIYSNFFGIRKRCSAQRLDLLLKSIIVLLFLSLIMLYDLSLCCFKIFDMMLILEKRFLVIFYLSSQFSLLCLELTLLNSLSANLSFIIINLLKMFFLFSCDSSNLAFCMSVISLRFLFIMFIFTLLGIQCFN